MFAGTPAVAVPALHALHASEHELRGVLTRPPAPVGRKRILTPSPVHTAAAELGVPVLTDAPGSPAVLEFLRAEGIDCVAVVAYGVIIREPALSTPRLGWVNLHFSLLPAWRGAAPVQHAIMAGQAETGVSTFQIEAGLDTGPVFRTVTEPIGPRDTAGDLLERLAGIGAPVLVQTLDDLAAGDATRAAQVGEVTHAPTLTSADGRVDWTRSATEIDAHIRGVTPAPGAWSETPEGRRFKLGPVSPAQGDALAPGEGRVSGGRILVGTGTDPVELGSIAPPGKGWMAAADWARGARTHELIFKVGR